MVEHRPFKAGVEGSNPSRLTILVKMKPYEIIDHTADIGLRVFGQDLKSLFVNAASGMCSRLVDTADEHTGKWVKLELDAPGIEELFLSWLRELLYRHNTKRVILKK